MIKRLKSNAFAWNSLVLFSGTMVANVINYIFHLIVGRMVSVNVYGEIESLISLITIVSVPSLTLTLIATDLSSRAFAKDDKNESYQVFAYLHKKVFKFGIPVFLLAMAATPWVARFMKIDNEGAFLIVWLLMFLSFLTSITSGILNGWQKFRDSSLTGVWGSVSKLVFAVAVISIGFELGGALGGFGVASIVSYGTSFFLLRHVLKARHHGKPSGQQVDFGSIKAHLMPILLGNLAITLFGNLDMVLAKRNLDEFAAGQYGALTIVSKIIFFATGVIATVLFSMSSQSYYKKDNPRQHLKTAALLIFLVAGSATVVYFLLPNLVLGLLFRDKYAGVADYLGWFAVAVTLFSFNNLFFQYLLAIKRTRVVYPLLAISMVMAALILVYGTSIYAIIIIVTAAQAVAIIAEALFLLEKDPKETAYNMIQPSIN